MIVSYQAEKTLGRKIAEGAERIQIMDHWYDLNAAVYVLDGFSGHADRNDLAAWFEATGGKIGKGFLVHGEQEALDAAAPRPAKAGRPEPVRHPGEARLRSRSDAVPGILCLVPSASCLPKSGRHKAKGREQEIGRPSDGPGPRQELVTDRQHPRAEDRGEVGLPEPVAVEVIPRDRAPAADPRPVPRSVGIRSRDPSCRSKRATA